MNNLFQTFDSIFSDSFPFGFVENRGGFPKVNVLTSEEGDESVQIIEMALAGYKKENLTVEQYGFYLTVKGKRNIVSEKNKFSVKEISNRDFVYTISLNTNSEVKEVSFVDGILSIKLKSKNNKTKNLLEIK